MIKVLIVDDSAVIRQVLRAKLESAPDIEVIGTACDPYEARDLIAKQVPDVITLDVEMPRMDGIAFLRKLMSHHPIPTVIVSSVTQEGTKNAIDALQAGAVQVLAKPANAYSLGHLDSLLLEAVRAASTSTVRRLLSQPQASTKVQSSLACTTDQVLAIGASTGGTRAIEQILTELPADCAGTLIVQHMPAQFTKSFADRLQGLCRMEVCEAKSGDTLSPGKVLIAPGDSHMLLRRNGARYFVEIKEGPLVSGHRPSVDVLFRSVAKASGTNAVGVLLTGMGSDGAKGLLEMRQSGSATMTQDEASSIVYGMPMQAVKIGASEKEVPLDKMAGEICKALFSQPQEAG